MKLKRVLHVYYAPMMTAFRLLILAAAFVGPAVLADEKSPQPTLGRLTELSGKLAQAKMADDEPAHVAWKEKHTEIYHVVNGRPERIEMLP